MTCSTVGRGAHRLVRGALERDRLAAAREGIRGDEQARAAAVEARGHRLGAVAREARRVHRADPRHRERGDHRLRAHGQEDPDRVARADPEPLERVGQPVDLPAQLRVGQRADRPVLRLGDHRGLAAAARRDVPVDAVVGQVEPPALEPARPGDALGLVEHAPVGREPVQAQVARDRVPVPLGVRDRAPLQVFQGREAVLPHEAAHAGARGRLGVGPPDDLGDVHGSSSPRRRARRRRSGATPRGARATRSAAR